MNGLFHRSRRRVLVVLAAVLALAPLGGFAQGLSKRTVKLVVPFTTGTGPDAIARLIAPRLQARWDQPFIVENRAGASGTIGAEMVAKSAPDGHVMMVGSASSAIAPLMYQKISYNVVTDLTPVTMIGSTSLALVVHKSVAANNLREFIAWVKSQPGKLNYASPGNGTNHHLCMELLKASEGLDIVHIPYKGLAGAATDLIGGTIPMMFLPIHTALPMLRAGQVKVLGETLQKRHPLFPDVPSLAEQGVKGYDVDLWLGVWGPAALPADILSKYNSEIRAIVAQPDMREHLANQGMVPNIGTPAQFAERVKHDYEKWARVIAEAKIRAD